LKKTGFVPPEQLLFADQAGAVSGSERVRDTTAKTADGQEVEFWTLSQAVLMLCDQCNRDEEFIKNPDAKVLKDMMGADDRVLRAHRQPLGQYLNVQLDALLRPYGFDWCIDYLSPGKRQIRVFARGRGTGGRIKMQASGQDLDMDKTNAEDLDLTADVSSRCVNAFRVLGDYVQIEATWELVPAWDSTHDEADDEDLIDSSESWSLKDPENTSRVWRDWVLNEAGDYNDLRDGIEGTFDLAPFLGPCVNRRRKFEPTITLNTDGSPIGSCGGIEVEWWDSADAEWKKLTEIGAEGRQVNILSHECGIRFDGEVPPVELMDQGIDEETGLPFC
jgi:hypothetical protein